jgi:hypothetical protein
MAGVKTVLNAVNLKKRFGWEVILLCVVVILLYVRILFTSVFILLYRCPHTIQTKEAFWLGFHTTMCPHTSSRLSSYYYVPSYSTSRLSSYYYIGVLILLQ